MAIIELTTIRDLIIINDTQLINLCQLNTKIQIYFITSFEPLLFNTSIIKKRKLELILEISGKP